MNTLGWLLELLTEHVLVADSPPSTLSRRVEDVWIFDGGARGRWPPRALVLAVGVDPGGNAARELLDELTAGDAGGVVFMGSRPPTSLLADARARGLAVLRANRDVGWGQLYSLVSTALGTRRWDAGDALSDVPLGDLFALANAVARLVGGATTIEDAQSQVLAYSNLGDVVDEARRDAILGRKVPESRVQVHRANGLFRALSSSREVVRVPGDPANGLLPRNVAAIWGGGVLLGSIWVVDNGELGAPRQVAELRKAAEVAALHLIRARLSGDMERRRRSQILRALVEGRMSAAHALDAMGFPSAPPATVVAFETVAESSLASSATGYGLLDSLGLVLEARGLAWAGALCGQQGYLLVAAAERAARLAVGEFVATRSVGALVNQFCCGVSGTAASPEALPEAVWEAGVLVALARDQGRPSRIASADGEQAYLMARRVVEFCATQPRFSQGVVARLAGHDRAHQTSYVATLRAYVDSSRDVTRAARLIGVHDNTLRYRIARMVSLFGLDLNDVDQRLVVELQLRVLDWLGDGQ